MKIVRGRLSAADVSNPSLRYFADCDCIQYSPDGGSTWTDAPQADPRHSTMFLKPPVSGSHKECDGAANKVKWIHDFIDQMLFDFTLVASVTTIINSILLELEILAPYIELLALISELAETISTLGATALEAAFTPDQYALLLCIFECNCDTLGRVSAAQLATTEALITARLNTTAALITNAILSIQGEIGLSNAGAVGSETGDCTGCECGWCLFEDFTLNDGGYVLIDPSLGGHYAAGCCWADSGVPGVAPGIFITTHFTAKEMIHIEYAFRNTDTHCTTDIRGSLAGVEVFLVTGGAGGDGSFSWDGDEIIDQIDLIMSSHLGEGVQIYSAMYQGLGTAPDLEGVIC